MLLARLGAHRGIDDAGLLVVVEVAVGLQRVVTAAAGRQSDLNLVLRVHLGRQLVRAGVQEHRRRAHASGKLDRDAHGLLVAVAGAGLLDGVRGAVDLLGLTDGHLDRDEARLAAEFVLGLVVLARAGAGNEFDALTVVGGGHHLVDPEFGGGAHGGRGGCRGRDRDCLTCGLEAEVGAGDRDHCGSGHDGQKQQRESPASDGNVHVFLQVLDWVTQRHLYYTTYFIKSQ